MDERDYRIAKKVKERLSNLGDNTETGCNSVMTPGTLLGPKSVVYPNTTIKGYYPANSIIKAKQELEVINNPTSTQLVNIQ